MKRRVSWTCSGVSSGIPAMKLYTALMPTLASRLFTSNTWSVVNDAFTDPYGRADREGMVDVRRIDGQRGNAENLIQVRPVTELSFPNGVEAELSRAMKEKAADDVAYEPLLRENGYSSLSEWSRDIGYFGSEGHRLWAEAAEARTGGQVPAEWWMEFDPFGGSAGAGPDVIPQGFYPGTASRIAMAHDTDWSLGRYFGAGPMEALRGAPGSADALGMVGLGPAGDSARFGNIDNYTNGHPDWIITYYE